VVVVDVCAVVAVVVVGVVAVTAVGGGTVAVVVGALWLATDASSSPDSFDSP
jgi:hypothetical protein